MAKVTWAMNFATIINKGTVNSVTIVLLILHNKNAYCSSY